MLVYPDGETILHSAAAAGRNNPKSCSCRCRVAIGAKLQKAPVWRWVQSRDHLLAMRCFFRNVSNLAAVNGRKPIRLKVSAGTSHFVCAHSKFRSCTVALSRSFATASTEHASYSEQRRNELSAYGMFGGTAHCCVVVVLLSHTFLSCVKTGDRNPGWSPYPAHFPTNFTIPQFKDAFKHLTASERLEDVPVRMCGRIVSRREAGKKLIFLDIVSANAQVQVVVAQGRYLGDWSMLSLIRKVHFHDVQHTFSM